MEKLANATDVDVDVRNCIHLLSGEQDRVQVLLCINKIYIILMNTS